MIYEAHSTDYQTVHGLRKLVEGQFAILKVGPELTFAYREAIFALAMIEDELFANDKRSNIISVLETMMQSEPSHWKKYYHGTQSEQAFKRKFSLSDRVRYYWVQPEVQSALQTLLNNVGNKILPYALLSQFVGVVGLNVNQVIEYKIDKVLKTYTEACNLTINHLS